MRLLSTRRPRRSPLGTVAAALALACAALALIGAGSAAAAPAAGSDAPAGGSGGTNVTAQVSVFFLRGEKLAAAPRSVTVPGLLRGVLLRLLAGPTAAERRAGLVTTIPSGTRLNGVTLDTGIATVDLSRRYESGGGSLSMLARLAQLTRTLTQFSQVHGVLLRLDGKPIRVFGGEGLILDHPLTRADFRSLD